MADSDIVYIRKGGWNYHTERNCVMLSGGDYERLGYFATTLKKINRGHYHKHNCIVKKLVGENKNG